ncbi:hypothetical protein SCP_1402780 [Sparassis crispa]|uniref:Uncharacterized protein n=1 Tax=Sparassis crispa TaxID=139825 RepID=A0A401H3E1_9APHY|nr:hypothetical protein SCP_1402780 [Sparassis crispa]GBE88870.1 hypothetical protein SCP_1402780 [Sparassis crispa]
MASRKAPRKRPRGDWDEFAKVLGNHSMDLIDESSVGLDPRQSLHRVAYQAQVLLVKRKVEIAASRRGGESVRTGQVEQQVVDRGQADIDFCR